MITCDAPRLFWALTASAVWLPVAFTDDGATELPAVMHPARTASIANASAALIIPKLHLMSDTTCGLTGIVLNTRSRLCPPRIQKLAERWCRRLHAGYCPSDIRFSIMAGAVIDYPAQAPASTIVKCSHSSAPRERSVNCLARPYGVEATYQTITLPCPL